MEMKFIEAIWATSLHLIEVVYRPLQRPPELHHLHNVGVRGAVLPNVGVEPRGGHVGGAWGGHNGNRYKTGKRKYF